MTLSPQERSLIYSRLAQAFSYPQPEDYASIKAGDYLQPFYLLGDDIRERILSLTYPTSLEELQQEYTRLFDVGRGTAGPPCPLYEGCYRTDWGRSKLFEELLRFYNFFGLGLSPDNRELPDHLTVELEFMHFLTYQEAKEQDNLPFQRAQRDFVKRHLLPWLPFLQQRLEEAEASDYFKTLCYILNFFVTNEFEHLQNVV